MGVGGFLNFYFLFCFFIFVNLREGDTNLTKKIQKKKANTSGQTDGRTHRGVAKSASQINGSERQDIENKYIFIFFVSSFLLI